MDYAIEVKHLVKTYDSIKAVNDISFFVEKNTFFAFLGPNGAGKSTTINIISTLLDMDQGEIKVLGKEVGIDDDLVRENIGVVFQASMLDDVLTVKENLLCRASFYNIGKNGFEERMKELDEFLEFMPFFNQKYGTLSGGQRRKADIVRALLNWPQLLILDEPTTGLDPKSRKDIWLLLSKLREKKDITIFLTTHYMEEVKDANKIVVINDGIIVAEGSSEDLRKKYSNDRLKVIPKNNFETVLVANSVQYYKVNGTINIPLESCYEGLIIIEEYKEYISEFEILRGDMDDVFVNITGRKLGDE
jgi:multidrug/hemolysin transport system ATP-binding protein